MWRWKRRKQSESSENRTEPGKLEERAKASPPGDPLSGQRQQIFRLVESGRYRTALDEVLRALRHEADDFFLLQLGAAIAAISRTGNLTAAEPTIPTQGASALLAPIATQCSSCGGFWYSKHRPASPDDTITLWNPRAHQCQKCRYTLCRDCLSHWGPGPHDPIDSPQLVTGSCPEHGPLGTPVLATGRNDVTPMDPDCIEAVIVTREGPIPPTMDQALAIVTKFLPLIADDAPLIHIRASKPGLMANESGRDELALARIHDLEREGVLAPGAWNRSERIFIDKHGMPDTRYLLTVIRSENKIHPHLFGGILQRPSSPLNSADRPGDSPMTASTEAMRQQCPNCGSRQLFKKNASFTATYRIDDERYISRPCATVAVRCGKCDFLVNDDLYGDVRVVYGQMAVYLQDGGWKPRVQVTAEVANVIQAAEQLPALSDDTLFQDYDLVRESWGCAGMHPIPDNELQAALTTIIRGYLAEGAHAVEIKTLEQGILMLSFFIATGWRPVRLARTVNSGLVAYGQIQLYRLLGVV